VLRVGESMWSVPERLAVDAALALSGLSVLLRERGDLSPSSRAEPMVFSYAVSGLQTDVSEQWRAQKRAVRVPSNPLIVPPSHRSALPAPATSRTQDPVYVQEGGEASSRPSHTWSRPSVLLSCSRRSLHMICRNLHT
jgi:hypothetical protein